MQPKIRQEQPVYVTTRSAHQLLNDTDWPLALDSYQRGFVWDTDKVIQLVDDLVEYGKRQDQALPYYMGTVLLHVDVEKQRRFIIDGQQRITALSLLYHQLIGSLPPGQALNYSEQSARHIRQAAQVLKTSASVIEASVFDDLQLTVIEVSSADLAFTFFDTQNNRGVRLHATDLLKAFHLRAIDQAPGSETQRHGLERYCAERWEHIQQHPSVLSPGQDFAPNLFNRFLWRARRWRGGQAPAGAHDALLEEFQDNTWPLDPNSGATLDSLPVYACRDNRLATALILRADGERDLQGGRIRVSQNPANLPMALRQPIHRGIGFFLYTDKYAALLQALMKVETSLAEVVAFRDVYKRLLCRNQEYLREAFMLASLMYVDQFEYEFLEEFALRLEFLLGAVRLNKKQVRQETAANFFKNGELNLLDVITQSHHPRQVLEHLKQQQRDCDRCYHQEGIARGKGVQGRYMQAVFDFYRLFVDEGCESLVQKASWLEQRLRLKGDGNGS